MDGRASWGDLAAALRDKLRLLKYSLVNALSFEDSYRFLKVLGSARLSKIRCWTKTDHRCTIRQIKETVAESAWTLFVSGLNHEPSPLIPSSPKSLSSLSSVSISGAISLIRGSRGSTTSAADCQSSRNSSLVNSCSPDSVTPLLTAGLAVRFIFPERSN